MESETRKWIEAKLKLGYSREQLESYMLAHGYSRPAIDEISKGVEKGKMKGGMSVKVLVLIMFLILLLGAMAIMFVA